MYKQLYNYNSSDLQFEKKLLRNTGAAKINKHLSIPLYLKNTINFFMEHMLLGSCHRRYFLQKKKSSL